LIQAETIKKSCGAIGKDSRASQCLALHSNFSDVFRSTYQVGDPSISHVKIFFFGTEGQPFGFLEVICHESRFAGFNINSIDIAPAYFAFSPLSFVVEQVSAGRISEPDRAIGLDDVIVGGVQPLPITGVTEHSDAAIMFRAHHSPGEVFARNEATLAIHRVPVCVFLW
jgi:hypothetical protein